MTPAAFLKAALAMPGVDASSHHGAADLRIAGKIFATPADRPGDCAILKLTCDQQEMLCQAEPAVFSPVAGGWGRKGWTRFHVKHASPDTARSALWTAWRNVAPKKIQAEHPAPR